MNIEEKALKFAIKVHYGQVRKSEKDKPMIVHPINVGHILKEYDFDENVVAAGYLHDVVEDTKYEESDILKEFGSDIASLVMTASEPIKSLPWEERKQHTIDTVKNLDLRHKAVVCADKISNLEDLIILSEKQGNYDFSAFNRGYDSQKWYYTEIYNSLVLNDSHPMFDRLKKLLDHIFSGNKDSYVEEVIYDNDDEYSKVLKLHYKKLELNKLKNVFEINPYVIEFTGTPRTGKTTLINNLKDFFKKGGFDTSILEEFTTSERYKKTIFPKLKNEYKNVVNMEIPKYVLQDLEEELQKNKDIIIVDRCLFDRLIWVDRLYLKDGMTKKEYDDYKEFYIPKIKEKINIIISTYTDSLTSIRRDYKANLSLEKRSFLNETNVDEYNKSLFNMEKVAKEESINFHIFDTTKKSERDISIEVANKILDDMRKFYLVEINKRIGQIVK